MDKSGVLFFVVAVIGCSAIAFKNGCIQGQKDAFDRVSQVGLKRAYLESKMTKEEIETFQRL